MEISVSFEFVKCKEPFFHLFFLFLKKKKKKLNMATPIGVRGAQRGPFWPILANFCLIGRGSVIVWGLI